MRNRIQFNGQTGGITILVVLFLLVLLTISALAMSRNSLREIIISGTTRQGTEVRNIADNGIEWSCLWITPDDNGITKTTATGAAKTFRTLLESLAKDPTSMGKAVTMATVTTDKAMAWEEGDGAKRAFSLSLMIMGKQQIEMTGGAPSTGASDRSQMLPEQMLPDIWSIGSTGELKTGGVTFQHTREGWITAPPQPL